MLEQDSPKGPGNNAIEKMLAKQDKAVTSLDTIPLEAPPINDGDLADKLADQLGLSYPTQEGKIDPLPIMKP
jgi:hypothetical protein